MGRCQLELPPSRGNEAWFDIIDLYLWEIVYDLTIGYLKGSIFCFRRGKSHETESFDVACAEMQDRGEDAATGACRRATRQGMNGGKPCRGDSIRQIQRLVGWKWKSRAQSRKA